jgi:hypothetical protein
MLAERLLAVLTIGGACVLLVWFFRIFFERRHRERLAHYEALRAALQHPHLDPKLREQLAVTLAQAPKSWWETLLQPLTMLWFGAGWALFVGGGGALTLRLFGFVRGLDGKEMLGIAAIGLGMLTTPFAWHEWNARRLRSQALAR